MKKKTRGEENSQFHESDWLELVRCSFRQNDLKEIREEQEKLEKDIIKFNEDQNMKAFEEACNKLDLSSCLVYFMLGEYEEIFRLLLINAKFFKHHLTVSDCFYTYCWISDCLVSFMLTNSDIKISHDVIVDTYDRERKKLDSVFEAFIKEFTAGNPENNGPLSETIEHMIRKNKLLPEPDPETKKYTASGSIPETIAWLKLNNLQKVFPPKLFNAMINTKCKPWIIAKYYRDI